MAVHEYYIYLTSHFAKQITSLSKVTYSTVIYSKSAFISTDGPKSVS